MRNGLILDVKQLQVYYSAYGSMVRAVDRIDFTIEQRRVLGIVGESGSGKSTVAKAIMRALPSNAKIKGGEVLFDGANLLSLNDNEFKKQIAWRRISMIPQAAMNSLDPLFRVRDQIHETLKAHSFDRDIKSHVTRLLGYVDLQHSVLDRYPHELSGGMKQRLMILMALLFMPRLMIADEPTTALDVLTQQHILKKLREIRHELSLSMILISHDLPVVVENCEEIAIMYAGEIVEHANVQETLKNPRHPYTVGLLNSHPDVTEGKEKATYIPGAPPSLSTEMKGCKFAPRCPLATEKCLDKAPNLLEISKDHLAACYHFDKVRNDLWLKN